MMKQVLMQKCSCCLPEEGKSGQPFKQEQEERVNIMNFLQHYFQGQVLVSATLIKGRGCAYKMVLRLIKMAGETKDLCFTDINC